MSEVREISTAPIGERVLLYWSQFDHWESSTVYEDHCGNRYVHVWGSSTMPTHWMPLPIVPAEQKAY